MPNRTAVREPTAGGARVALASLTLTVLACGLVGSEPAAAQEDPAGLDAGRSPAVTISVDGVHHRAQPRARVELGESAYVAVFEVEPGVGATLLWPEGDPAERRRAAGTHDFRLNGPPAAASRSLMLAHLGWAFAFRSPNQGESHLVAVASRRPFRLGSLHSGRVFSYTHGFAGAREVTGALLAEVVPSPLEGDWSYDQVSFGKFWDGDPTIAASRLAAAPFLPVHVPLDPALDLAGSGSDVGCPVIGTRPLLVSIWSAGIPGSVTPHLLGRELSCFDLDDRELRSGEGAVAAVPADSTGGSNFGGDEPDGPASAGARPALPEDVAQRLRRIADATRSAADAGGDAETAFQRMGRILTERGIDIPAEALRRARQTARARRSMAARQRVLERLERLRRAVGASSASGDRDLRGATRGGSGVGGSASGTRPEVDVERVREAAEKARAGDAQGSSGDGPDRGGGGGGDGSG